MVLRVKETALLLGFQFDHLSWTHTHTHTHFPLWTPVSDRQRREWQTNDGQNIGCNCWKPRARNSSVGIATRYGLDGPEIESWRGGEIFRTRPYRPWGPPSLLYNWYRVFRGGKAVGAWCWPPIFSAEVLNRVELYLYPP